MPLGIRSSRVQYLDDNTGRVFRQGGVGKEFQLETGHETAFYYAKPNGIELSRMFGTNVGYNDRYLKKLAVIRMARYLLPMRNSKGQVIANALARLEARKSCRTG